MPRAAIDIFLFLIYFNAIEKKEQSFKGGETFLPIYWGEN